MSDEPFRALVVGDLHLKKNCTSEYREMLTEIHRLAKQVLPDMIWILGDTFHDKENIKMRTLTDAISFFRLISEI